MHKQSENSLNIIKTIFFIFLLMGFVAPAKSTQVIEFTPTGHVQLINSVHITFDEAIVPFGSANQPSPINISCTNFDFNKNANGRWLDQNRFTYELDSALDAGIECSAEIVDGLVSINNQPIQGQQKFNFFTGSPRIVDSYPYSHYIHQDQIFALKFNGEIADTDLIDQSYCSVDGIGEQIAARVITGDEKLQLIEHLYSSFSREPNKVHLLQCVRNLPANADMQLIVGESELSYTVRDDFKATLSCQRENARSDCLPITDIDINFSSDVDVKYLQEIKLHVDDKVISPIVDDTTNLQGYVRFNSPFPPNATLSISLPADIVDAAGRELINVDQFPLEFKTSDYPPLVKFASGNFGVIERFANNDESTPTIPLTLRNVQPNLLTTDLNVSSGKVSDHVVQNDIDVINWYGRLNRLTYGSWTQKQINSILNDQVINYQDNSEQIDVRAVSVLTNQVNTKTLQLPGYKETDLRPFEVIGVPIPENGLHILEVQSPRLGQSLIKSGAPMYVRTMALVTNLGVHLKTGRDDSLVWVTTLDDAKPVPNADINILDCEGNHLAQGVSDINGLLYIDQSFDTNKYCTTNGMSGIFASARIDADHPMSKGQSDYAFVFSNWNDGIESWRFNVPTNSSSEQTKVTHTVLDRNLLRAGETVSMKHFVRSETRLGLEQVDKKDLPNKLIISHYGSGNNYEFPVKWQSNRNGGLWAHNEFEIPKNAKLGNYYSYMTSESNDWFDGPNFSVQDFKLPVFTGYIQLDNQGENAAIQLSYLDAGPAANLDTTLSALSENSWLYFSDYDEYSFNASDDVISIIENNFDNLEADIDFPEHFNLAANEYSYITKNVNTSNNLFINKQSIKLNATGGANIKLDTLPKFKKPQRVNLELSFADPNGQIQTITQGKTLWPANLQAGIKAPSWSGKGSTITLKALAIDRDGNLHANKDIQIRAIQHKTYSSRKRLVGGFYSYDNYNTVVNLGQVCSGKTDVDGYLNCSYPLEQTGDIEFVAILDDGSGGKSYATTDVWVSGGNNSWYGGNDDDRIDIIPEKKTYKPGDLARFKVLMPYQNATVLVAVEREGILETQIQTISSKDPMVNVQIKPEWGPNVYVSVLALRGRVKELLWPDTSGFNWRSPKSWSNTIRGLAILNSGYSHQVDLSKPSFKFGLAKIIVLNESKQLNVKLSTQNKNYQVGSNVKVEIEVHKSDGTPASNGSVAFAAVDQALLELSPNGTWNLLQAMYPTRSYGVKTATAQMHIVGRRHYGRKAVPSGGGGGKSPTRELLDTLLLWQPNVQLDENGKAVIDVKLNDAITKFALVAIADYDLDKFGTSISYINSTRDLQIIPGLPSQVRMGDSYQAQATLRNTTNRDMQVDLSINSDVNGYGGLNKQVTLNAGQSETIKWPVQLPNEKKLLDVENITWNFEAKEINNDSLAQNKPSNAVASNTQELAFDSLKIKQSLSQLIPVQVQQSATYVLNKSKPKLQLQVKVPQGSVLDKNNQPLGGLDIGISNGPITSLDNLGNWFSIYNFFSLEYAVSRAVVLNDNELWQKIIANLNTYIDEDGLLKYYSGMAQGNEVLTAYVLSAAYDAYSLGQEFLIPQAQVDQMIAGLANFITGKITRHRYAPQTDLDVRKLLALDAISRFTNIPAHILDSIKIDPNSWPTAAVIAWVSVLQTVQGFENRAQYIDQATNILKARMLQRGSSMVFANSVHNQSSWIMATPQSNQARLIMATRHLPQWSDVQHLLLQGLVSMQRWGSWQSSTANTAAYLAISNYFKDQSGAGSEINIQDKNNNTLAYLSVDKQDKAKQLNFSWDQLSGLESQSNLDSRDSENDKLYDVNVNHTGDETWLRVSSLAAVANDKTINSGFEIKRSITPVAQANPNQWQIGDIFKVKLEINTNAPMAWVAVKDALPPGAVVLGYGTVNKASLLEYANRSDSDYVYSQSYPAYTEVLSDSYNAIYDYFYAGTTTLQYTVRLSTPGSFNLPATRVQSIYEPDVYGELPILDSFDVSANN